MKVHVQKLPLNESTSFVARTYRTPNFEVGWHQHMAYELIMITEGSGLGLIGNYVGEFEKGDIFFLGSNVPHTFRKGRPELVTSAVVIQFEEHVLGFGNVDIPESREIKALLVESAAGLRLGAQLSTRLRPLIIKLENASGFKRMLLLMECLYEITQSQDYQSVSTQTKIRRSGKATNDIERVINFTIENFPQTIRIEQCADLVSLSVPAFCNFFKKSTKKSYVNFLNEIRVGYACKMLAETDEPVASIAYEAGYGTLSNFFRQFQKVKKISPLQYRKCYLQ